MPRFSRRLFWTPLPKCRSKTEKKRNWKNRVDIQRKLISNCLFLNSNKINQNTMYTQINHFNKYDIGKQPFQKTLRKLGNKTLIGFYLKTNRKYCEIDNNTQPTNPCIWYSFSSPEWICDWWVGVSSQIVLGKFSKQIKTQTSTICIEVEGIRFNIDQHGRLE